MPKQTKLTKKLKAKRLTKVYMKSGLNQSKVARRRGVTRQAINKQVNKKPVTDILQKFLDSPALDKKMIRVADEGLDATKVISCYVIVRPKKEKGSKVSEPNLDIKEIPADEKTTDFIDVPDHNARHKFLNTMMEAKNKIKAKSNMGEGVHIYNIVYGHREAQKQKEGK